MLFILPPLLYAFNALEPHIDAKTMEIHYTKHHQAYVDNLNAAIKDNPEAQKMSLEELVINYKNLPESIREVVRNNAGGHLNHSWFWQMMSSDGGGEPTGELGAEIIKTFGSFEAFKKQFDEAAKKRFGSGWAWLCVDPATKKLTVVSTLNQDNPLTDGLQPILGLDVWEHAYYLKYQNRRPEYITAWWNVVNWAQVAKNYASAIA